MPQQPPRGLSDQIIPLRSHSKVAELMTERGYPMTRSRVTQIEKNAIRKMRLLLEREGISFDDLDPAA